jgi:hypothetical protein
MEYSQEKILEIIEASLDKLFEKDSGIILKEYNLHERSITHRLAIYLEDHFKESDYIVDVEYNRMRNQYGEDIIGNEIGKRLDLEQYGKSINSVYPDIIVHKRDTDNNLVEIEVKMQWKNDKKIFDLQKINEYISQLNYNHGVYLELGSKRSECNIEFGPFEV